MIILSELEMNRLQEQQREQIKLGEWYFNEINIDDYDLYSRYTKNTEYPVNLWSSSFSYIWAISQSRLRKVLWRIVDDMLVTFIHSYKDSLYLMLLPMGKGSPEKVVKVLYQCMNYCYNYNKKENDRTLVKIINEHQLEYLKKCPKFDKHFKCVTLQGIERHFDIDKLVSLKGKEFSSLRNRVNKFKRENDDAKVCGYKPEEFDEVMELGSHWSSIAGKKYSHIFDAVYFREIIKHYAQLKQDVLCIKKNERIIGMVTGSLLPNGQAWGSIVKYEPNIPGLSETLIIEFAKLMKSMDPNVKYLNVGSDLGPGGLREYKLKFRPALNFKRYQVYLRNE